MCFVVGLVLGNQDSARRLAFPFGSETHTGYFGSESGCFRVGMVVFLTPWYQEVRRQRSDPGFTEAVKARACDRLATTIWKWNCFLAT